MVNDDDDDDTNDQNINVDDDDDDDGPDDYDVSPGPSIEAVALATPNTNVHVQLVGRNDEHLALMVSDPDIFQNMQEMNVLSNQQTQAGVGMTQGGRSGMGVGVVVQPDLTASAATNAADGADVLIANTNEDWINKKWRPVMGWMYMAVCTFDFILAPILWSIAQAYAHGAVNVEWQPLTLQGAGLFHIAMGAILGITAYGRTQEKIQGVTNTSTAIPPPK